MNVHENLYRNGSFENSMYKQGQGLPDDLRRAVGRIPYPRLKAITFTAVQKRGKNSLLIKIYRGRGTDGKKKFYTETFHAPLKSMARARERELKVQLPGIGINKSITFLEEWLDGWLPKIEDDVAPRTWREYASMQK